MGNSTEWPWPWKDLALEALKSVFEELGIKMETPPSPPEEQIEQQCPPPAAGEAIFVLDAGHLGPLRLKWAPRQLGPVRIIVPLHWDKVLRANLQDFEDRINEVLADIRKGRRDISGKMNAIREAWNKVTSRAKELGFFVEDWQFGLRYNLPWGHPAKAGCLDEARDLFDDAVDWNSVDPFSRRDPLILDVDGDGIETTSVKAGVYFDSNADGFGEQTGWVASDDGLLAMDRSGDGTIGDGKELFGDQTILKNGKRATGGFVALAELDDNKDGKIDASDPAFSQLRVVKGFDEIGYEIHTLDELGIKSIGLDSSVTNITDPQGNSQNRVGTFERADGTIGQIAEYNLQRDTMYTIANEWLDVPGNIAALPDLPGYGAVYDLHQAMVRDTTGQLRSLLDQFCAASDPALRNALNQEILFEWTGSDGIDSGSRGTNIDARKLAVLEKLFGQSFVGDAGPNPTYE